MIGEVWIDGPNAGAWNMALDAAMLAYAAESKSVVLRLYLWERPTLSLGYFQNLDAIDSYPDLKSLDLVRRSTGGGAIIHDFEVTYSLAIPLESLNILSQSIDRGKPKSRVGHAVDLYHTVHQSIREWLISLGYNASTYTDIATRSQTTSATCNDDCNSFLCFERRAEFDLVVGNDKVLGSAQRRSRDALLQHGSLILGPSFSHPHIRGLGESTSDQETGEVRSQATRWLWLIDLCDTIQTSFDRVTEIEWRYCEPTNATVASAQSIVDRKYGNRVWTERKSTTPEVPA